MKLQSDKNCKIQGSQRGIVLFLALIALVVMSLAAVALIRSVDTNTLIAGNLATKQSAIASADAGLETAISWLGGPTIIADPTILEKDNAANAALGYYSTQAKDPTTFNWNSTDSKAATSPSGTVDANGTDASGNTVRFVIQRMCRNTGAAAAGNCLFGAPYVPTGSKGVKSTTTAGAQTTSDLSPMFRVTARVVSVKNTVSYIQTFVY